MTVKLLRSIATGAGALNPGAVVSVPDALARAWVEAGLAVYADEAAVVGPDEAPAVEPAERAVVLPAERRRRRR